MVDPGEFQFPIMGLNRSDFYTPAAFVSMKQALTKQLLVSKMWHVYHEK